MRQRQVSACRLNLVAHESTVMVPMLKDDQLISTFAIYRQEVRPFISHNQSSGSKFPRGEPRRASHGEPTSERKVQSLRCLR